MTAYVGEIRLFAGNFPPAGWEFCDGQLLPISENETLFTLIGTTYGGNGQDTFALPNLTGRVPIHVGSGYILAETGGVEEVTLTIQQIPVHNHALLASAAFAQDTSPQGNLYARSSFQDVYIKENPDQSMNAVLVGPSCGSQPHSNMQPYLGLNFIISLFGIFPSQTQS